MSRIQSPNPLADEAARLAALAESGLLDSPPEEDYDAIVRLAAESFDVPMALVSLIDADRQWFKARHGIDICETPRDVSFCDRTIRLGDDPLVVTDATADPYFADNPLVTGPPHVRFYAGAPLVLADGVRVGTLCIIDTRPRLPDPASLERLVLLARLVASKIDLARRNHQLDEANAALARELRVRTESEQRLRDIAETGPGVLYQWVEHADGSRGFSWVSPRSQAELGIDPEALMADWRVFQIHDDDRERWARTVEESVSQRAEWHFEGRYWRPDGRLRWWSARARPAPGENPVRYNGLLLDITEQKIRDQDMARRERLFREITEAMPALVSYLSPDGRFLLVNSTCVEALGVPRESLLGRRIDCVLPPEVWRIVEPRLARAVAGERMSYEADGLLAEGRPFAFRATYIPDRDVQGRVVGVYSIVEDISDFRQREARLIEARDAAREMNQAKTNFLATMSHELRTPLNAIIGFAELMTQEVLGPIGNPAYRNYLHDIVRSGRHLSELLTDILDLSRIEAGHHELVLEPLSLDRLVRECVEMMPPKERDRIALSRLSPARVTADPRAVRQILLNVVSNALKFSPPESAVEIGLMPTGQGWDLTVTDHGTGIHPDDRDRVIEPFIRGSASAMVASQPGTGIGLAIVHRLCLALNWRLSLESEWGAGTTVRISVPV